MIHYQLRCSRDHAFDGWFKDSAAFDLQAEHGLLECPDCGATDVRRALMAPSVPRKGNQIAPAAPAEPVEAGPPAALSPPIPARARALLQRLRAEVEKHGDYVGDRFADEARRIHHAETGPRAIYGDATKEQAESLRDEGIDALRIPWLPLADG